MFNIKYCIYYNMTRAQAGPLVILFIMGIFVRGLYFMWLLILKQGYNWSESVRLQVAISLWIRVKEWYEIKMRQGRVNWFTTFWLVSHLWRISFEVCSRWIQLLLHLNVMVKFRVAVKDAPWIWGSVERWHNRRSCSVLIIDVKEAVGTWVTCNDSRQGRGLSNSKYNLLW